MPETTYQTPTSTFNQGIPGVSASTPGTLARPSSGQPPAISNPTPVADNPLRRGLNPLPPPKPFDVPIPSRNANENMRQFAEKPGTYTSGDTIRGNRINPSGAIDVPSSRVPVETPSTGRGASTGTGVTGNLVNDVFNEYFPKDPATGKPRLNPKLQNSFDRAKNAIQDAFDRIRQPIPGQLPDWLNPNRDQNNQQPTPAPEDYDPYPQVQDRNTMMIEVQASNTGSSSIQMPAMRYSRSSFVDPLGATIEVLSVTAWDSTYEQAVTTDLYIDPSTLQVSPLSPEFPLPLPEPQPSPEPSVPIAIDPSEPYLPQSFPAPESAPNFKPQQTPNLPGAKEPPNPDSKPGLSPTLFPSFKPQPGIGKSPNPRNLPNPNNPLLPSPSPIPTQRPASPRPGNAPGTSTGGSPGGNPSAPFPGTITPTGTNPRNNPGINADATPQPKPQPQLQPQTDTPTKPCDDPCIADLQNRLNPVSVAVPVFVRCQGGQPVFETRSIKVPSFQADSTRLLYNRLAQIEGQHCSSSGFDTQGLIDSLLQALGNLLQSGDASDEEFIEINVPVVTCNNGTAVWGSRQIPVLRHDFDLAMNLFTELANIKAESCSIQKADDEEDLTKRIYQILGGDDWFKSGDSPRLSIAIEKTLADSPRSDATNATPSTIPNLPALTLRLAAALYNGVGLDQFPAKVSSSLLSYTDQDDLIKLDSLAAYLNWFVGQFDAVMGQFPIEIEVEDADPIAPGKQTKKVEFPNVSEALAELFGMQMLDNTASDISTNFLMRIAAELVATKNAALITQDYARGNASFLGYRGNPIEREIQYAFNPSKLENIEDLLQPSTGKIIGWQEDDPETVVGFLQKIVFSAGIIKAVFFRNKKRIKDFEKELKGITEGDEKAEAEAWAKFLRLINTGTSQFNAGDNPQPHVDNKPVEYPPDPTQKKPKA